MAPKHQLQDLDSDFRPRKKPTPKVLQPEPKTEVTKLAADPLMPDQNSASTPAVEDRVLERIRKCLAKANHPGTAQAEVTSAIRMSSILMAQHNVTHAQILEKDMENEKARLGGESVVTITAANKGRRVLNLAFAGPLAGAMGIFFDCKCYSTDRHGSINWTFYGITTNTAAAAVGFEMAYNLTVNWASSKKGISVRHSYRLGVAEGLITIAETEKDGEKKKAREREVSTILEAEKSAEAQRAREIDRLNFEDRKEKSNDDMSDRTPDTSHDEVVDALESPERVHPIVKDEIKDEDVERVHPIVKDEVKDKDEERVYPIVKDEIKDEDEERVHPIIKDEVKDKDEERVHPIVKDEVKDEDEDEDEERIPPIVKDEDEEDEERFVASADFEDDLDEPDFLGDFEIELRKNRARETAPPVKSWESEMQLVLFRAKAGEIADEYLQKMNIKLSEGRKTAVAKDYTAFCQGKKDSHKIDVRRKRLEAASS